MSNVAFWILMSSPFLIILILIWSISNLPSPTPITSEDLDREDCDQLRELGWSENEIEEYMDNCGGHYEPPTPSGKTIL